MNMNIPVLADKQNRIFTISIWTLGAALEDFPKVINDMDGWEIMLLPRFDNKNTHTQNTHVYEVHTFPDIFSYGHLKLL